MRRIPFKNGDEYDALTDWKHVHNFKKGQVKGIKRRYNKRMRRIVKKHIEREKETTIDV